MNATQARPNPLAPLYDFVRGHLLIVNNMIAGSGALIAALDFLGPRLSILPKLIYGCTAFAALLMLVAGVAPGLVERLFAAIGKAIGKSDVPLWRRPAWQFATALLIVVSILGFASVAKAAQGGALASQFPAVRSLQEALLDLGKQVAHVRAGVDAANAKLDSANGKLDRIAEAVDPDNVADRCSDLSCASYDGASAKAMARLFAKGERVPENALVAGSLLNAWANSDRPQRAEVVGMLYAHGLPLDAKVQPLVADPSQLNAAASELAAKALAMAQWDRNPMGQAMAKQGSGGKEMDAWTAFAQCVYGSSGGLSPLEVAAMRGDKSMWDALVADGVKLPERPLVCKWNWHGEHGGSRIVVVDGSATVRPLD